SKLSVGSRGNNPSSERVRGESRADGDGSGCCLGPGLEGSQLALALRMTKTTARATAEQALLDAAERLLVEVGYARISTPKLADEAGVNHGLVHYYFGSNENLLVRTL